MFSTRTDLAPHPSLLSTLTATQIKAFRRLVRLEIPGKPRDFRCIAKTADALVSAGLAVVDGGLYRSALVAEVEAEISAWFELFATQSYTSTGLVTVARPGKAPHYLRFRTWSYGSMTVEVLPVKGFPLVNSTPMQLDRLKSEGWQIVIASDEDCETIRSAGLDCFLPEVPAAVEPAPAVMPVVATMEATAPAVRDVEPFRLVSVPRIDQADWWFSSRQQRIAAFLGVPDFEPTPKVIIPPAARVAGILGHSYRVEPIAIDPAIGSVAYSLHDTDRNRLYSVYRCNDGEVVCTCGDFEFRRAGSGASCKHGRALADLGLIASTTPRVLTLFVQCASLTLPIGERSDQFGSAEH